MEDRFQEQLYLNLDSLEEQTTDLSKSTENDLDRPDLQQEEKKKWKKDFWNRDI